MLQAPLKIRAEAAAAAGALLNSDSTADEDGSGGGGGGRWQALCSGCHVVTQSQVSQRAADAALARHQLRGGCPGDAARAATDIGALASPGPLHT